MGLGGLSINSRGTVRWPAILEKSVSNNLEHDKADAIDWRRPIIDYLHDLSHKVDRKVRWLAFKFTLVGGELYH
jgi:hypothetical protein